MTGVEVEMEQFRLAEDQPALYARDPGHVLPTLHPEANDASAIQAQEAMVGISGLPRDAFGNISIDRLLSVKQPGN